MPEWKWITKNIIEWKGHKKKLNQKIWKVNNFHLHMTLVVITSFLFFLLKELWWDNQRQCFLIFNSFFFYHIIDPTPSYNRNPTFLFDFCWMYCWNSMAPAFEKLRKLYKEWFKSTWHWRLSQRHKLNHYIEVQK